MEGNQNLLETTMEETPIQANMLILPSVRMLERMNVTAAITARKTAVHAPWSDSAFKAMEIPSMAELVVNM